MDQRTDRPTKKWLIELRSTQLKMIFLRTKIEYIEWKEVIGFLSMCCADQAYVPSTNNQSDIFRLNPVSPYVLKQVCFGGFKVSFCVITEVTESIKVLAIQPVYETIFITFSIVFPLLVLKCKRFHGKAIIAMTNIRRRNFFLVTCYATLHPALSVRWSIGSSVTLYFFCFFVFFAVFDLTAPAQVIKWPQIWPPPTRTRLG